MLRPFFDARGAECLTGRSLDIFVRRWRGRATALVRFAQQRIFREGHELEARQTQDACEKGKGRGGGGLTLPKPQRREPQVASEPCLLLLAVSVHFNPRSSSLWRRSLSEKLGQRLRKEKAADLRGAFSPPRVRHMPKITTTVFSFPLLRARGKSPGGSEKSEHPKSNPSSLLQCPGARASERACVLSLIHHLLTCFIEKESRSSIKVPLFPNFFSAPRRADSRRPSNSSSNCGLATRKG